MGSSSGIFHGEASLTIKLGWLEAVTASRKMKNAAT
jgi:hypothetical protein